MVDVNFITSLKCSWINRLTQSHELWLNLLFTIYENDFYYRNCLTLVIFLVIECLHKVNNDFFERYVKFMVRFYIYLWWITQWQKLIQNSSSVVWYNSNIHIANKCFHKSLEQERSRNICFDENWKRLSINEF